jgi:hypothetical protein
MVNALEAGTIAAVMAGVAGWFMTLRRQTFAGHTLSLIAFPGAGAAALAGLPAAVGYFLYCGLGEDDDDSSGNDLARRARPRGRSGRQRPRVGRA